MSKSDFCALQDRLVDLAVKIIQVAGRLPKTVAGRHIAVQILRSGTSSAANYAEARGAESRADFIHKLRVALKELNETAIWLVIIMKAGMAPAALMTDLLDEDRQLSCILNASIKTAQSNQKPHPR
jgi:four helix bundle protein